MKKKILDRLQLTPAQYEFHINGIWLDWCNGKTTNGRSLQKALCCSPLFNWWQRELVQLEKQFLYNTELYAMDLDVTTMRVMYNEAISPIYKRFSKPLLKRAITNN